MGPMTVPLARAIGTPQRVGPLVVGASFYGAVLGAFFALASPWSSGSAVSVIISAGAGGAIGGSLAFIFILVVAFAKVE